MCNVIWLLFSVPARTAAAPPGICNCGMTGNTVKDIKFWDCVYEVLHVVAACKRSCGWKYVCKLRQLTSVVASVLWQHTLRSSRDVSQENADEQSDWGGAVVRWDATLQSLRLISGVSLSLLFMWPEGLEGTGWYFGEECAC